MVAPVVHAREHGLQAQGVLRHAAECCFQVITAASAVNDCSRRFQVFSAASAAHRFSRRCSVFPAAFAADQVVLQRLLPTISAGTERPFALW